MRWPLVRRSTLDSHDRTHEAHLARRTAQRDVFRIQRDLARDQVDSLLIVHGLFGDRVTGGREDRALVVQAMLDERLTKAVHFRETTQAGGMAGTGYVQARINATAAQLWINERHLP